MSKKTRLAIIGCRGIPNRYGGFEQFAEKLALGLVSLGMEVWVYHSHRHPCSEPVWQGVHRIPCYDPEHLIGQAGQFIYDWNCISDSRKRRFDIILQLGYTSNSIWHWRIPSNTIVVTNMDGLEWSRSKYSPPVRSFLHYAEKLAVLKSHVLVADSPVIQRYLYSKYGRQAEYIPYGAELYTPNPRADTQHVSDTGPVAPKIETTPDQRERSEGIRLADKLLLTGSFTLVIARMQADNHIETIIQGHLLSKTREVLLIVGNTHNRHGKYLVRKYGHHDHIVFAGAIFNQESLDQLRQGCRLYFHGHSSGGTNPSLLEAMAASAFICAHDNPFNRAVLKHNAWYFASPECVRDCLEKTLTPHLRKQVIAANVKIILAQYNWESIISAYHNLFNRLSGNSK